MSKILQLRPLGAERMQLDLTLFEKRIRAEVAAADVDPSVISPPPPPASEPGFDYDLWRDALARDLADRPPLISMVLDHAGVKAHGTSSRRIVAGALIGVTLFGAGAVGALRSVMKPTPPVIRLAMIEISPPAEVSALVAATPNLAQVAALDSSPTSTIPAPARENPMAGAQAQKIRVQKVGPTPKSIAMPVPRPQARAATPDLTSSVEALLASAR